MADPANIKVPEGISPVYIDGEALNPAAEALESDVHIPGHSAHPPEKVAVTSGHSNGANLPD